MALVFLDTNVLVYLSSPESEHHQAALDRFRNQEALGHQFVISGQVLREFLVAMTRSQQSIPPEKHSDALQAAEVYSRTFQVLLETPASLERLRALVAGYQLNGKVIHDANIVAVMLDHGVTTIVTHNTRDLNRFSAEGLQVLSLS